jgi:hypothetical protein
MRPVFYALGVIGRGGGPAPAPVAQLRRELDRAIERLRTFGVARLRAPHSGGRRTVAESAHELTQLLADATARLEGGPRRPVPRLADHAAADQLAVLARDLVGAATRTSGELPGELRQAVAAFRRGL